jgi:hypothetical protein
MGAARRSSKPNLLFQIAQHPRYPLFILFIAILSYESPIPQVSPHLVVFVGRDSPRSGPLLICSDCSQRGLSADLFAKSSAEALAEAEAPCATAEDADWNRSRRRIGVALFLS